MNLTCFLGIFFGTVAIGAVGVSAARSRFQRLALIGVVVGLYIYSGVGATYREVSQTYVAYYFLFMVALLAGFHVAREVFQSMTLRLGRRVRPLITRIQAHPIWLAIITTYVLLHLFGLVYPEFRLRLLVAPPAPDLTTVFLSRFSAQHVDVLSRLVRYSLLLLEPFFYIALFRWRNSFIWLAVLLFLPLYLEYVDNAYIGRGRVMVVLAVLLMAAWYLRPRYRICVAVVAGVALVGGLYVSYIYARVRLGGTVRQVGALQAVSSVVESETSFPRYAGERIIESEHHVNLRSYLTWIVTLPIPKLLTGPIPGARINYEMAEIYLRRSVGQRGWYVALPGLVAESVYIFGSRLFWLHGVFLGVLCALMVMLLEPVREFTILLLYVVTLFAYTLNRAGVAAVLPVVINNFLLLYVFLAAISGRDVRPRSTIAPVYRGVLAERLPSHTSDRYERLR